MNVPIWAWGLTVLVILIMIGIDYFGHVRKPHFPSIAEAGRWSLVYVAIALVFGGVVWLVWGPQYGGEYIAGWVTEKSLSVDNLFVFVLILSSFKVPREYQQKVLLIGITIALIMRTIFIMAGATLVAHFSAIFYLFGLFLLWTAWTQVKGDGGDDEFHESGVLRLVRRMFPVTESYVDDRMTYKVDGRRMITPMLVVMIAIGSADLLFAVDSIPAIFGLTQEAYLVFTANAFALLGLRQLFFLIDGLLEKLVYLNYGLAVILGFIGVKLLNHALHLNELPFINDGQEVDLFPEITTSVSLIVILGVLLVTTVASLIKTRADKRVEELEDGSRD